MNAYERFAKQLAESTNWSLAHWLRKYDEGALLPVQRAVIEDLLLDSA